MGGLLIINSNNEIEYEVSKRSPVFTKEINIPFFYIMESLLKIINTDFDIYNNIEEQEFYRYINSLKTIIQNLVVALFANKNYPYLKEKPNDKISKEEAKGITLLNQGSTRYPQDYTPEVLETFVNKHPENDYFVKFNCPEFTSLCPITGQPDFATITISYVPGERMVESKSLKLYLYSFRNHGDFHEDCVNIIMKDLIRLMDPKYIEVWGKFTPRGGISIDPYCNYGRPGTKWEEVAWQRLSQHDLYPEKVDNR